MLGDHAVLERYTEARRRFAESEHEVVRQTSSVQKLEMELRQMEWQVAALDDWERRRDKVAELEARLPAAELQVELRRFNDASAKLSELRTKLRRGEVERVALDEEVERARGAEQQATEELPRAGGPRKRRARAGREPTAGMCSRRSGLPDWSPAFSNLKHYLWTTLIY